MTLVDREAPPGTPTPVDLDLEKVLRELGTFSRYARLLCHKRCLVWSLWQLT